MPAAAPAQVADSFNPDDFGTRLELSQIDRYDPAALAAKLAPGTPLLLSWSDADDKFTCAQEDRLAASLRQASTTLDKVAGFPGVVVGRPADVGKQPRPDALVMPAAKPLMVNVDHNARGGWAFALSDSGDRVECETLEDARRLAYLCAASRRPCELIVRDAYHRVLHREVVDAREEP